MLLAPRLARGDPNSSEHGEKTDNEVDPDRLTQRERAHGRGQHGIDRQGDGGSRRRRALTPIANRGVAPATPPRALDAIAASTPTYSFRKVRMQGQERRPTVLRQQADVVGRTARLRVQSRIRAEDYRASLPASPLACPAASRAPWRCGSAWRAA